MHNFAYTRLRIIFFNTAPKAVNVVIYYYLTHLVVTQCHEFSYQLHCTYVMSDIITTLPFKPVSKFVIYCFVFAACEITACLLSSELPAQI